MIISTDKKIDTKYIKINEGKISKTESLEDWLFVDLSEDGNIMGIEILNASLKDHNITIDDIYCIIKSRLSVKIG